MSDNKIVLIGYSGHGLVVADSAMASDLNLQFYTEKDVMQLNPYGLEYLGFESDSSYALWNEPLDYILGIGDNTVRSKVAELVMSKNRILKTVIDPSAIISEKASIGHGTYIGKRSILNTMAQVGDCCIINSGSIIEHDCKISNGVHVAPGATLLGNVVIGEQSFVGANAVIKENITIGKHVVIGAGAIVLKDVPDFSKVAGNPAKAI